MVEAHSDSIARHWLAKAHRHTDEGRIAEAVNAFQHALSAAPRMADAWYDFGVLLRRCGQAAAAEQALRQALATGLRDGEEAYLELALVQAELRQDNGAAEIELERALALSPKYVPAWLNLGNLAEDGGDRERACECYRAALSFCKPESVDEMRALARLLHASPRGALLDESFARTKVLLSSPLSATSEGADLWFAFGRRLEQQGDHPAAFDAFVQANRAAAFSFTTYDAAEAEHRQNVLLDAIHASPCSNAKEATAGNNLLFIVGMFRSGSTLLEQMLAAHPQIASVGECPFFPRLAAGVLHPFPESLVNLSDAEANRLAARYRAQLDQLVDSQARSARIIIDKRPDNIALLPLIKRLFPQSRVIVTRRHPLDNGLSIFQHHLDLRHAPYGADLANIGHCLALHQRLVDVCQEHFGTDLTVVDYDNLVMAPESALRPLLAWLGLDWTPKCLEFYQSTAAVRTASVWQVREPVHSRARGRWRAYASQLEPLSEALSRGGVDLSASRWSIET